MKIIALLALFCTFSEVALAQAPECQSIPKASDRLACYDRAAPPKAVGKRAASKTSAAPDKQAAPATPADQGQVVDMLAVENSKLDARLKTICRGC
jgi:hypothetical protein